MRDRRERRDGRRFEVEVEQRSDCPYLSLSLNLDLDLSLLHSLGPSLGQGTFLGEEAVQADSGLAGEISARAGLVRSPAFLNSLWAVREPSATACTLYFPHF